MQKSNSDNNLLLNTTLVLLLKLVFHLIGDLWENKLFYKLKQNTYFTVALTWSWEIRVENKTVMFASYVFNILLIEAYNPYIRDLFNMGSIIKVIRRSGGKSCCYFLHSTVLDFRVIKTNQPVWYWVQD